MDISQFFIIIFGCSAIYFVSRKDRWKKYGYIFGLLSQPFWIYTAIKHQQTGILLLSVWYAYSWGMGIYNYWINPNPDMVLLVKKEKKGHECTNCTDNCPIREMEQHIKKITEGIEQG